MMTLMTPTTIDEEMEDHQVALVVTAEATTTIEEGAKAPDNHRVHRTVGHKARQTLV